MVSENGICVKNLEFCSCSRIMKSRSGLKDWCGNLLDKNFNNCHKV